MCIFSTNNQVEGGIVDNIGKFSFQKYKTSKYKNQEWNVVIFQCDKELTDLANFTKFERNWVVLEDAIKELKDNEELYDIIEKLSKHPYFHTPTCNDSGPTCLLIQ